MSIILNSVPDGEEGQEVESLPMAGGERQTSVVCDPTTEAAKAKVTNADPGNTAYGLAVRPIPRVTATAPTIVRWTTPDAAHDILAANAARLHYSVENDDTGGDGLVYVMEGGAASPTNWICRLEAGERWRPDILSTAKVSVYVTGSAAAQAAEWLA